MTDSNDDTKTSPRPYRVPPAEFRFKKGTSGNEKGRPPKERALVPTRFGGQPRIGFEERIKSLALEEAYRLITVREGDRVEKIPVIQAILRKVAVNAANGNTRAQLIYLEYVMSFEGDRSAAAAELLKTAVEYKEKWASVFAECDDRDIDRPHPLPHPDDVVIDYKTGAVRIQGPVLTEQREAQETALDNKRKFERDLEICITAMETSPDNSELRRTHDELAKIVDWLRRGAPFAG